MNPAFRIRLVLVIGAVALVAAACGGDDDADGGSDEPSTTVPEIPLETASAAPDDYAGFRAQPTACDADAPPAVTPLSFEAPEDVGVDASSRPRAVIATSCGEVVVELDPSAAPETVNSFVFLAETGYFDGTVAHRVAPGFVIQAGDQTATGTGGPGYTVPDEPPPGGFIYARGTVAMANAGPGTTGSQFFVMLDDAALPPNYSVFGQVTEGVDVLDTIAGLPVGIGRSGERSTPLQTPYLESVVIER